MIKRISHSIIRQFNASAKALFQHENILPSSSQNVANPNTKFINKTSLPDSIERDCQRWESALKKDMELKMENRQWLDLNFKCLDVFSHNRSSKLVISTENMSKNLTPSQKNDLSQILKVNSSIYLQIPNFSSNNCEHFVSSGIVVSVFNGGFSVYFNQPIDDSTPFLNKTVQIQLSGTKTNISQLEFLRIRDTWHSLPGYDLLLYAYKCNKREEQGNRLVDSLKLIEGEDLETIEERLVFAAALNLQRKLVSIHIGGQARTRMVAKYLDIITKKNSNIKIAIISPQIDQLYLTSRYHEMYGKTNFVSIQKLDLKLLQNIVKNPDTRALIERKSVEPGKGLLVEKAVNQGDNIVFIGHSNSLLKIFISSKIVFDVVILDGAERRSEIGSWQPILSLSSCARLFGDYAHLKRTFTPMLNRSLIQRLDESFGEEVNFHITNPRDDPM
uniref:Uncharacterized protein n=1 Tax=Meloidogyne enterolobii TaxID=390850 RepID=A0A6V7TWJ9_MELEN|nr:unnamed protein product [Meloidogyne enterolobii]